MIEELLNKEITNEEVFFSVLQSLIYEINCKNIEQIDNDQDIFSTIKDIREIFAEKIIPDFIHCYFRNLKTNQIYLLEVESYHGVGGVLQSISTPTNTNM